MNGLKKVGFLEKTLLDGFNGIVDIQWEGASLALMKFK